MRHDTIHWLYAVPGKKKGYIVVLILVQALLGASGVFYALLLRNLVDAAAGKDPKGFWYHVLLTVLLVAVQIGLRAVIRWINELSAATFENRFKSRLMHTLLQKDYATVCAIHSGEWMNRLTNDTVVVAKGYVEILPGLAGMAVKMLSAFCMLIALDVHFAAILIPGGVLLVVLTWLFRKVMKGLHKAVQETDGNLRIFLQECMGSMLMLRSFAAEEQTAERAGEKMEAHLTARMSKNRFSNLCNIGFGSAMNGMYLFGVIYCGYGILTGTVSFGTLTAITQLISQIQVPFANITGYLPRFYAMLASAERLMEMEAFSEDEEKALPRDIVLDFYTNRMRTLGLRDATFQYYPIVERLDDLTKEDMPPALEGLSLEIRKGQYIALTGHSGCGKSTVLKVLMCVYGLDGGARYLADAEGNALELNGQWRRLFAYVPQGNQLMSGTIREIISFPEPEAAWDEDRLSHALKVACAGEFVGDLERGVDTLLGERGTGLSEGQMQRLAIARAVFSQSPILLLDEATSALDAQTEKLLLQNLRSMTDKTVLIVTHRPEALEICDRVLRFTENGVKEQ